MNHLYKIIDKNSNLITFKERSFQREIREHTTRILQILKYRQGGVTTGCVLDLFDDTIWNPNRTSMIMAHKKQDLPKIFDKVRLAHKEMPDIVKPKVDKGGGSKYEMKFPEINSKIYIDIENRGDTVHRLHVSEAAYVEKPRLVATMGAVVPTGRVTHESTANGMSGDFYKHWIDPKSDRGKLFFPWFIQPEYQVNGDHISSFTKEENHLIKQVKSKWGILLSRHQIAWRRVMISEMRDQFWQEYPENDNTCFLSTGQCPIDQAMVSKMMKELPDPIINESDFKMWKPFEDGHRYVIGADVAQGVKSDFSVADVFDCTTKEQVAQFRSNNCKPFQFAEKIQEIASKYWKGGRPWPLIAVELNNHGHAVNGHLHNNLRYSNLYHYKIDTPGWLTSSLTRPKMIDTFLDAIESGQLTINSKDTLAECLTLVDNQGKIEATEGEHDDCIISGSIAIQMIIADAPSDIWNNMTKKILV